MPPFGTRWFKVLEEPDHPVAILRLEWMFLNMGEDRRLEDERRKDECEYIGLCAQPGALAHLKGLDGEGPDGFRIVQDTAAYRRKYDAAMTDDENFQAPQGRRLDVAGRVKEVRERLAAGGIEPIWETLRREAGVDDPMMAPPPDPVESAYNDTIIVEEPPGEGEDPDEGG